MDGGCGEALCLGVWPRWKTSTMRILLPQHGQLAECGWGSAIAGSALVVASWSCMGTAQRGRSLLRHGEQLASERDVADPCAIGNRPEWRVRLLPFGSPG